MDASKTQMKDLYLPIILIEIYLGFSLILYQFGPVQWKTANVGNFWFYIILYHLSFIVGYVLTARKYKVSLKNIERYNTINLYIVKYMWVFLFICAVLSLIKAMGLFNSSEFIPLNLPSEFIKGLFNPGEQYRLKMAAAELNNYTGNKITSGILALFAFIVSSMIPVCVLLWNRIKLPQKIVFFTIVLFEFTTFVSVGTNKGIFDLLFLFSASILIFIIANYDGKNLRLLVKDIKLLVGVTVFLLFFSMWFFSWTMKSRVVSIADYTETLTEDVSITEYVNTDPQGDKTESLFSNFVYGMSSYIGQGYYGMSLSIGEEFTSTYGLGNSRFLSSNFKYFFGIDVEPYTYQAKISDRWDQYAQWHSFYSYMANDFSFPGVAIIMFLIGASLAAIYKDAIYGKNIFAQCLLPVYAIMFLYMPANNQVFTFMQSFSTFFELMILWYLSQWWNVKKT